MELLGFDLHDVVLFLELLDHRPSWGRTHGLEIQTTEDPELGRDDTDFLSLGLGHDTNAASNLILGGKSPVEERNYLFLGTAGKGQAHEDIFESGAGARKMGYLSRHNPELLTSFAGRVGIELGVAKVDLDFGAGGRVDFPQESEQVLPGLHVMFRNSRRDESLDENGSVVGNFSNQPARLSTECVKPLGGGVQPETGTIQNGIGGDDRYEERHGPYEVMQPHGVAVGLARPVSSSKQEHVHIQEETRKGCEVEKTRKADDPTGEVPEVSENSQGLEPPGCGFTEHTCRNIDEHQHAAEKSAQDIGKGHVHRKKGGQHTHRNQRSTDEPVPDVVAEHQSEVRTSQPYQDQYVAERKGQ